jgi:hypothetical protein
MTRSMQWRKRRSAGRKGGGDIGYRRRGGKPDRGRLKSGRSKAREKRKEDEAHRSEYGHFLRRQ